MKIGIMTWFRYYNYGTVLQAYALQQFVNKLGYESYLIDYQARGINSDCNSWNDIISKFRKKVFKRYYTRNKYEFDNFVEKILVKTKKCNNYVELKSISKDFDGIICGSDQIWSPNNYDENMFLTFASENKIMSYAPSFGVSQIDNEFINNRLATILKRFEFISTREETGKRIINNIIDKKCEVVLDPTLLLEKSDWEKFGDKSSLKQEELPKKYLLCYFLGKSSKYLKNIENYATKKGLSIINIPVFKNAKINKYNINKEIGPAEFVKLFLNATCIFTDSFHGTIFSINFEKEFFAFKRFKDTDKKSQNSRVVDLLNNVGLSDRLISRSSIQVNNCIDYTKCKTEMNRFLNLSKKYLVTSLTKIVKNNPTIEKNCNTEYCCGCSACTNICPKNAITMEMNEEGFYVAKIDEKKCVSCGLCKKVCPMRNVTNKQINNSTKCYSLKANNRDVLMNSSSGGASHLIAEQMNKKGYYIVGCSYDNHKNFASHIIIKPNSIAELDKIRGSKYIQSKMDGCINDIINIGKKGEKAVIFGTPCQIAGIDKLLNHYKIRDNYILVDLICHGVPSFKLWNKYINEIKKKNIGKINNVYFRDKKYGWRNRRIIINGTKSSYVGKDSKDDFYVLFRLGIVDNKSCYECPYRIKTSSDIKIGDFWGDKFHKDNTGVSIVLANTSNGIELIQELENTGKASVNEQDIENYYKYQYVKNKSPNLNRSAILKELDDDKKIKNIRKRYTKYEEIKDNFYHFIQKVRGK